MTHPSARPVFGLGSVQLGMPYGFGAASQARLSEEAAFAVLDAAWDVGVRLFDTARLYGVSEERIGRWTRSRGRDPRVITKLRKHREASDADAAKAIVDDVDASRSALGLERLDCVLFHAAEDWRRPALRAAARDIMARGSVARFGVSVYEPAEASDALNSDETDLARVVQAPASVANRTVLLGAAKAQNAELHVRSVLLQGALVVDPKRIRSEFGGLRRTVEALWDVASDYGAQPEDLAIAAVLIQPAVSAVILGADAAEQIAAWPRAAALAERLLRELAASGSGPETVLSRIPEPPSREADPRAWRSLGGPLLQSDRASGRGPEIIRGGFL